MLRFDNITVFLKRPVSVMSIAEAIDVQPFEVSGALIPLEIFLAPTEQLSDEEIRRLGENIGVDFRIDEDGGSSTMRSGPIKPDHPPSPEGTHDFSKLSEETKSPKT